MIRSARRRRLPALLAITALGAGAFALSSAPAQATADFAIARIAGPDRAATAAQIALNTFPVPPGAPTALIARSDTFPDALAGNFAAGLIPGGAPMLLSGTNAVPSVTMNALTTLGTDNVILLGGTTALSPAVAAQLTGAGFSVSRIDGADRFATAAAIATGSGGAPSVGLNEGNKRTAVLSSGLNFPDALAAGPIVYSEHFPQLLTGAGALPEVTKSALAALDIDHVIITGGPVAVPSAIETELTNLGYSHERIQGATRYLTALEIARKAGTHFGFQDEHVNLATGENFPDALAGGPLGGKELAATILLPSAASGTDFAAVCDALEAIAANLSTAHAFGGPVAISDAVLTAVDDCATPDGPTSRSGQIVGEGANTYTFVDAATDPDQVVEVVYDANDTFTVNGGPVSAGTFAGEVDPGDQVTFTDDPTAGDADVDVHALTNVSVLSGMVGNVNTALPVAGGTFSIINPVTGTVVGGPFVWDDATDNFNGTLANFEGAISEGDTIVVAGTQAAPTGFTLTNAELIGKVTGELSNAAGAIIVVNEAFGDDATSNLDSAFAAQLVPDSGAEKYTVDGNAAATYATFEAQLSVGDTLGVKREVIAGVSTETFTLTNVAPAAISGQVTDEITTTEDPVPPPIDLSGDQFDVVPAAGGYQTVDYSNTPPGNFKIGALVVTETEFEAALTPGDTVVFQPGSTTPAVVETITLTNAPLQGQIANFNNLADTYQILAANEVTVLATISYVPAGANRYFVNAAEVNQTAWEARLASLILTPAAELDDTVVVVPPGLAIFHQLTTNDP